MKYNYYESLKSEPAFLSAARNSISEQADVMDQITAFVSAPVIFSYAWWVLSEAKRLGLKRIYFLARDGFLFYHYARKINRIYDFQIDCRYLYASRLSWRIPSYHLIGEEARHLIFGGGYQITPEVVLGRLGLNREERESLYAKATGDWTDTMSLPVLQYREFSEQIASLPEFQERVTAKSKQAYRDTIGYLKQEGLLDGALFGIADTGWTGSMQRTLRQLLEQEGFSQQLHGFYFGMYRAPKSQRDGAYHCWYFSWNRSLENKLKFNNNLLESICICPHPMTVGYECKDGKYLPRFHEHGNTDLPPELFQKQFAIYNAFLDHLLKENPGKTYEEKTLRTISKKLLTRFMYTPQKEEAAAFAAFCFCDDVAESYQNPIVEKIDSKRAGEYLFFRRLFQKLFKKEKQGKTGLFWSYGSLAFSEIACQGWYRFNILLWDLIRGYLK